ncbi:Segment polarity protein dishevelled protein DVL-3 [Apis cerana cerana]|uniref:Segment polarity protein dishevelled protein DVL-3 n=1 Tax=Apis cerana cerana TaxID=94128 RepID=A0A2A3EB68_APICC|nr:Segment polarity protein dishevelled protein DVL-3 [Apis cerana cerana]
MWITPCQRRNRVIFVPCAALAIDAERRMHEETRTQTSDLDNNSRDNIYEEDILEYQFLHK